MISFQIKPKDHAALHGITDFFEFADQIVHSKRNIISKSGFIKRKNVFLFGILINYKHIQLRLFLIDLKWRKLYFLMSYISFRKLFIVEQRNAVRFRELHEVLRLEIFKKLGIEALK